MESNNDKFKPQNLFARGRITNVTQNHAFVQDSHERSVFVPSHAVLNPRCYDLTKKFDINEEVIFAAVKQIPPKGSTEYQATSIVKKEDLQSEKGRISDVSNGCAFGETSCGVRVFIPFTARNENDQEWRMRGASEGAPCEFGLMPQVEKGDCRFLAATIVLTGENKNKVNVPTAPANNKPRNPVAPHTPSSHQSLNQEPKPAMPKKEMNPPLSGTQKAAESKKFKCPKSEEVEKESKNAQLVRIFKEILSDDELFKQIFMRFPEHAKALSEVMKS